ncbi:MAG: RluA family pseudouridine synthase [Deltaproteobacteria bacterium]|nr:RluA family pseudouridine synthase [Deltaproteobacteria bacterium]
MAQEPELRDADPPRVLVVPAARGGERLDRFLASSLGISRARVRELLEGGGVREGDRRLGYRDLGYRDKGAPLRAGARLEIADYRAPRDRRIAPEATGAEPPWGESPAVRALLARGPGWLALDKRAGAPVHPLREEELGTVLNAVAARHPEVQGVGEAGLRSGVVHRLDVDTSGVLLVATEERAWQRLREAFRSHAALKVYRAIVAGRLAGGEREVELPLAVTRHRPARVRVVPERDGAWIATQSVRPLLELAGATLVEVRPRTGFLHQIRATLAHLGHPVAGDAAYGGEAVPAPRQMLHAARLQFEEIEAESPDPEDFRGVIEALSVPGPG